MINKFLLALMPADILAFFLIVNKLEIHLSDMEIFYCSIHLVLFSILWFAIFVNEVNYND